MKMFFENFKKINLGTKIRTFLLILTYINQIIALGGLSSYASSPVYQWISFTITLTITILSYWYNNDWTGFAQLAGDILKMLKDGKITSVELKEFVDKHKSNNENKKE